MQSELSLTGSTRTGLTHSRSTIIDWMQSGGTVSRGRRETGMGVRGWSKYLAVGLLLIGTQACRPHLESRLVQPICSSPIRHVFLTVERFGDDFSPTAFEELRAGLSDTGVAVTGQALSGLELSGDLSQQTSDSGAEAALHVWVTRVYDGRWSIRAQLNALQTGQAIWTVKLTRSFLSQSGAAQTFAKEVVEALERDRALEAHCRPKGAPMTEV